MKINGLTLEEVNLRKKAGKVNINCDIKTKSIKEIIIGNVFTIFNLLNFSLAILILLTKSYKNLLFLGVVLCNSVIAIFQEIRSKKVIDRFRLLATKKVSVVREKEKIIDINDIVIDDIIHYKMGSEIVCDGIILNGSLEVNEALITGESEPIFKKDGDTVLSGSFVVSGNAYVKVIHVGTDNYTYKISKDTKYIKKNTSDLMKSLNKILKFISILIVPIGICLFISQSSIDTFNNSIVRTVAALIGMIPEGLVLLTSTVLALSIIRLSKQNVLVQDLYSVETLARVNTIILDKTGTITTGKMSYEKMIVLDKNEDIEKIMNIICSNVDDFNSTMKCLKEKFNKNVIANIKEFIPFSSDRKYLKIVLDSDTYYLGSINNILKNNDYDNICKEYSNYRVITLVKEKNNLLTPIALLLLSDDIRKEVVDSINYFKNENVDIKIISGDDVKTVSNIAKEIGIGGKCKNLKEDDNLKDIILNYDILGRVTPMQKKKIVLLLKQMGRVVAMTGDGVNDTLALKEADLGVTLKTGSDAAKSVSSIILLDDNFSSLYSIILEGRRIINNIERSASLFLCKTGYSFLLALIFIFIGKHYPFIPIQLSLVSLVTIGIPSFILALEPNEERIRGKFLPNVFSKSIPASISIVINVMIIIIMSYSLKLSNKDISTLCVIASAFNGFLLIYKISKPFNITRLLLLIVMILIFIICFSFKGFFMFSSLNGYLAVVLLVLMICSIIVFNVLNYIFTTFLKK